MTSTHGKHVPLTPDGNPYQGIAVHVRAMAVAGDPAYRALWLDRTCFWCGTIVDPALVGQHRGRTFDHLVTKADRGGDDAANLRNSCGLCNHVRENRAADDFRKVADMVVRPNRDDLVALGHALLDWGLVKEARTAWTYAGLTRRQSNGFMHDRWGADAFDVSSKKGFEDLASVLRDGHAAACEAMGSDELASALEALPTRGELRRLRSLEAAETAARREALARELSRRLRGDGTETSPRPS